MIKKILPIIFCLALVFTISAAAENATDSASTETPAVTEEMPGQGARRGGGRGGMGMPPQGGAMPAMPEGDRPTMPEGERPAMPEGEMPPAMPAGEMTPPQGNENTGTENAQQTQPSTGENATDAAGSTEEGSTPIQRGGMGGGMPGDMSGGMGDMNGDMPENTQASGTQALGGILGFAKTYATPITSVILLALAFIFVIFYKRKSF